LYRRVTAPALLGNFLAVADLDGYVHLLSRRDGALLGFERVAKDRIGHRPVVQGAVAYVYANDGTVAALRASGSAGGGTAAVRSPQLGADVLPDLSPVVNPRALPPGAATPGAAPPVPADPGASPAGNPVP
jgi:outer membrane protein assembly factor BamB